MCPIYNPILRPSRGPYREKQLSPSNLRKKESGLTPASAEAAANCLSEVNGCRLEPYKVMAIFIVTVPLLEDVTGGTDGEFVTCWAETGPGVELTGAEA